MDKISIIVPIYNVELYIEKCLRSLIKQSYKNIEILAISDGSPDNSMKIVEEYAHKDKRIKAIYKENGGYGSVLEYAINIIDSKYFLICDPDDWIESNAVEILYDTIKKNKVDLVIGEIYKIFNDCKEGIFSNGCHRNHIIESNKIYTNMSGFYFFRPTPHAKLYKTEIAKKIEFPHKVSYTDNILYDVYLSNAKSAMYLNIPLAYYYFDRPGNTMEDFDNPSFKQKTYDAIITVFKSIFIQLQNNSCNDSFAYYRVYCELISTLRKLKNLDEKERMQDDINNILMLINDMSFFKNEMYKCINDKNLKVRFAKRIIFRLITSKNTQSFFSKILIKVSR